MLSSERLELFGHDSLLATVLTTMASAMPDPSWPAGAEGFTVRPLSDRQSQWPRADLVCLGRRSINRVINS